MRNKTNISKIFLGVYVAISLATLYHSSFGFGTIDGLPNDLDGFALFKWWFLGLLCATSVDVGMGAIVWSMMLGYKSKYLNISLIVLAIFSAYSQLIYSAYFATDMNAITNNEDLKPFMQLLLNIRIIILPLCLPFFSLFYGFVAKDSSEKMLLNESKLPRRIRGMVNENNVENITTLEVNKVTHYTNNDTSGKTLCGIKATIFNSTQDKNSVTCKNCSRININ